MLITDSTGFKSLGFNLDKQIAIFANWHTTWRYTHEFDGAIRYGERIDTDLPIDVPISDIKDFEIEDATGREIYTCLTVNFKNKRAYPGMEFSDHAWTLILSNDVETVTRLIEQIGIKVQKR